MSLGSGFTAWLSTLFPTLDLPNEIVHLDDSFNTLFNMGDGLGAFVPWGLVGLIAAVPLTVWVGGLAIRAVRALIAHLPFVGGRG